MYKVGDLKALFAALITLLAKKVIKAPILCQTESIYDHDFIADDAIVLICK